MIDCICDHKEPHFIVAHPQEGTQQLSLDTYCTSCGDRDKPKYHNSWENLLWDKKNYKWGDVI